MKENPNIYDLSTNPARLELYCNQEKYIVHFDIEDYDRISKYHWRLSKKRNKYYVCTGQYKNGNKIQYMSNMVMNFIPDQKNEVDHIDGNSLNNCKGNLRIIKRIDNIHNVQKRTDNTSGFRGVSMRKDGCYVVDFHLNKDRFYFKTFPSLEEAVYFRYLMENYYLKEYRNTSNDERIKQAISSLSIKQKYEIKRYWESKLR